MKKITAIAVALTMMLGVVYADNSVYISDVKTLCNLEYVTTYLDYECYKVHDNVTKDFNIVLNQQDKVVFFKNGELITDEETNSKLMTIRMADNYEVWYKSTIELVKLMDEIKKSANFNKAIGTVGKLGGASLAVVMTSVVTGGASEFGKVAAKAGAEVLKSYVTDVENILTEVKWVMLNNNIDEIDSTYENMKNLHSKGIKTYEDAKIFIDEATKLETDIYSTTRILTGALNNIPNDVKEYFTKSVFSGFTEGAVGSVMSALKTSDNIYDMMLNSDDFYNLCKFASDINKVKDSVDKVNDVLATANTFGEFSDYVNARLEKKNINIFKAGNAGNKAIVHVMKGKLSGVDISSKYDNISNFKNGMAIVSKGEKYGYIDVNGNEIVAPIYDSAGAFSNNLACVYKGVKFGFVDKTGKLAIPMNYSNEDEYYGSEPFEFKGDKCIVSKRTAPYENIYGVIDSKGNEIVPCEYTYLFITKSGDIYYSDDYSTYNSLTNPGISISSEEYYKLDNTPTTPPYWSCDSDYNWSLYDANNNCIVKNKYNFDICTYSEFSVSDNYFTYCDGVAIAATGAFVRQFAKETNRYWIVDEQGNEIKSLEYDDVKTFSEGLALIVKNGKYGYIDKNGEEVIPLKYDYAQSFDNSGVAIARKDSEYLIIKNPLKDNKIAVVLNNSALDFSQAPITENDRTLVPMRKIFESMSAAVSWNDKTQTVTASRGNSYIEIQIDSNNMKVNGKNITLDTPARLVNDQTFVPIRAVSEGLGAEVNWVESANTVTINQK